MPIIQIYHRKSKPAKKKPGWQKAAQEYAEWQSKIASMSSGIPKPKVIKAVKPLGPKPDVLRNTSAGIHPRPAAKYIVGAGTKPVHRPEITYKDDPEMLERELIARQRKFNVAPQYNKGADQFVSEEQLQALLSSNKRRS